ISGMIHAFIDRVNYNLEEVGKKPLSRGQDATVAIVGLLLSALLARVGISDLVDIGYTILGYARLIVCGLPMITIGVYKVIKGVGNKKAYFIENRMTQVSCRTLLHSRVIFIY